MPHAQKDMVPQVNGEKHSSVFLQHLTSFPVVSDTIDTYSAHPYGRRSIDLSHSTYEGLTTRLSPYLSTPYAYLSPYLARADSLGDSTLGHLEARFPALKKPTGELYADGKRLVTALPPLRLAAEGGHYLVGTYRGQVDKVGETNGPWAKWPVAAVTTGIVVAGDAYGTVQGWLAQRGGQVRQEVNGLGHKVDGENGGA